MNKPTKNKYSLLTSLPFSVFIFCLLACVVPESNAQTTKRIEFPVVNNDAPYRVIPLGAKGVLVANRGLKNNFILNKLNGDFERDWGVEVQLEDGFDLVATDYDGQSVFLLFGGGKNEYYQVVKVNVGPGFIENFFLQVLDKFQITEFKTLGYSVFLAGMVRDEPVFVYTNLANKQTKLLPSVAKQGSVIQAIEIDTTNHLVNVAYALRRGKDVRLVARTYNEDGQQVAQVVVDPEDDYSLLNGRLFVLSDSTKLMIGTYGFRNMQSNGNPTAQGIFISKITDGEVDFTQYHSFTDFQNFFKFMDPKQQARMEDRIKRKKERGDDLKLNYRVLVHDVIQKDGNFILVGEIYNPEYRYNNNPFGYNNSFGGPMMMSPFGGFNSFYSPWGLRNPYFGNPWYGTGRFNNNNQIFDGYTYTHAVVAGFDQKGALIWDNSLPFENVRTAELKEKVKVKLNTDSTMSLFYSNNGTIKSKIVKGNEVIEGQHNISIGALDPNDKVRSTNTDEVEFWFDNHYLAWGYQRIAGEDGRRSVFYLNKIEF